MHTFIGAGIALDTIVRSLMNIISASSFYKDYVKSIKASLQNLLGLLGSVSDGRTKVLGGKALRYMVEPVQTLIKRLKEVKAIQALVGFIESEDGLLGICLRILTSSTDANSNCLFFLPGESEFEKELNLVKAILISVIRSIITILWKEFRSTSGPTSYFYYKSIMEVSSRIVESGYQLAQSKHTLNTKSREECYLSCIRFMKETIPLAEFYSIYINSFREVISHVLLPNLVITEKELIDFQEDENEFVNSSFDLCYQQESKTIKAFSMSALEELCNKIDGALTFVGIGSLSLIDAALSKRSAEEIIAEHPNLTILVNSDFVKLNSPEKILDVLLLVVTAITFRLFDRADLTEGLTALLKKHLKTLQGYSPLILCRMFMLTSFILDKLNKANVDK